MAMRANPGKFDNAIDEAVWSLSNDGGPDEQAGSSSESPGTWAGIMRDGRELAAAIRADKKEYPNVTAADLEFLLNEGAAGVIVTETSDGFVRAKYYASTTDIEKDWKEIEAELSVGDDEELEANARGRSHSLNHRRAHRPNTSIADRRKAGVIEGLTREEQDSITLEMPTFDWKQIGGDVNPGAYGGTIATADGQAIELIKIKPAVDYVGKGEAADVGFPFWTRTGYYALDDLKLSDPEVQSAIEFSGLGEHLLDMTPEQRVVAIAEACLDAGHRSDEGASGWAKDVIGDRIVEWMSGTKEGYSYIADEDIEFKRDVLKYEFAVEVDGSTEELFETEEEAIAAAKEFEDDQKVEVINESEDEIVWDNESVRTTHTPNRSHSRNPGGFTSIDQVKRANKAAGLHFFDKDTISFWNSKIEPRIYAGRYFITSEQFEEGDPRLYSVRDAEESGRVKTQASRLKSKREAEETIDALLRAHTQNASMPELENEGTLDQLIEMQAESLAPDGQGHVPREVKNKLEVTEALRKVVSDYESALRDALEEVVKRYPPEDDASAADLFNDNAPYLVLMTLMGHGVGIWDGDWDEHYSKTDDVQALLKQKLGKYADDTGSGRIPQELDMAVYEAMREAGYGFDEETYVPIDEGGELEIEFADTVLPVERVEVIVDANGLTPGDFWSASGGTRRPLTRGEVDAVVSRLGGRFAKNSSRDSRWHVFLNGELLEPVYMDPRLTAEEVRQKLIRDAGYDSRITVDQPPARRTQIPPHYQRPRLSANRRWSKKDMDHLPDSAFLYVEPGGRKDAHGSTVPRKLRHFPVRDAKGNVDLTHVRNALARIPQSYLPKHVKEDARRKAERLLEQSR